MENYYTDSRVLYALEKSNELMDILTFIKEVKFEIQDNLGFDVLWDNMSRGKRCTNVGTSLLEWFGYEGSERKMKQSFLFLLYNNNIPYKEVGCEDPLLEDFPEIQKEIAQMRPIDKPRKNGS